ncbi:very-long-chain 3-oxoacyl-CoA reductase [Trifolium repens]|nr:very-long-chain 3-oxoacyl-CoA reductase [Trifolium repens]
MASSRGNIAAIVGVGPNLGLSIARKFAHEGYTVAILARDLGRLSEFADEIAREEKAQVFAIRIDCSDSRSVREAFEGVLSLGFVEVLVYNANYQSPLQSKPTPFQLLPIQTFQTSLAVSSLGAFNCAQQVLPGMVERGKGTILFTGCSASLSGIAGYSELCCGKFALRALSQCLAKEFHPQGVHVAHIIIDGIIGPPRGSSATTSTTLGRGASGEGVMDPNALAQTYWHLHVQDRNAWTQEMDVRSSIF